MKFKSKERKLYKVLGPAKSYPAGLTGFPTAYERYIGQNAMLLRKGDYCSGHINGSVELNFYHTEVELVINDWDE